MSFEWSCGQHDDPPADLAQLEEGSLIFPVAANERH
jgi:hypothetical protein